MKVFGHPFSTCTRKVLTTLQEKGAVYELIVIDFAKGEHKQGPHMARQPFGVVPTLEHNGFTMYESRAMIRYVDEVFPGISLTPSDVQTRAQMNQWISIEQSNFAPSAMKIVHQRFFGPMRGQAPDEKIVDAAHGETGRVLDVVEKHLTHRTYLVGDTFTLADISFMPYVEYLFASKVGDLITSRPATNAWWERVSNRPSWQKVTGRAQQS